MKKCSSFLFLTLLPLLSHAGVYVGALAGYGVLNLTPELTFTAEVFDVDADINIDFIGEDFIASPVLGYSWQWNRFRLGTELQAFWTSVRAESLDTDPGDTINIALKQEYVWLFRPGYQVFEQTPLWVYANLGAARAKLTATPGYAAIQAINFDDHVWGYKAGFGFAYDITPQWIVRADYIFSQYQTLSNTAPQEFDVGVYVPIQADLSSTQSHLRAR